MAMQQLGRITARAFSTSTKAATRGGVTPIAAAPKGPLSTASRASFSRLGTAMFPNTTRHFSTGVPEGPKSSGDTRAKVLEGALALSLAGNSVLLTYLGVCRLTGVKPVDVLGISVD